MNIEWLSDEWCYNEWLVLLQQNAENWPTFFDRAELAKFLKEADKTQTGLGAFKWSELQGIYEWCVPAMPLQGIAFVVNT